MTLDESPTDVRLRQHVLEELADDPQLDPSAIRVEASAGRIILTGSVSAEPQRQAAERAAWLVDTVRNVDNRLVVELGLNDT